MSILIKDLDMPKSDEMLCINVYPDGKVCINLDLECKRIATAVPVPPHGRLIDADALVEFIENLYEVTWDGGYAGGRKDACIAILERMETAPTVIPAEEGET